MSILFFEIGSYAFRFGLGKFEVDDKLLLVFTKIGGWGGGGGSVSGFKFEVANELSLVFTKIGGCGGEGGLVGGFDWVEALIDECFDWFFFLAELDSFAVAAEGFFFFDFDFGDAASILMKVLVNTLLFLGWD